MTTILELIEKHSNDELARQNGHVYQIWEDGEVTLQKSGELLNQRNLHMISEGIGQKWNLCYFPHIENDHGYAYVTKEGAEEIRKAMLETAIGRLQYMLKHNL